MKLTPLNNRRSSGYLIAAIGLAFLVLILITQIANRPTAYSAKLQQDRARKDLQFKNDPQSPILPEDKPQFTALDYFPVQEAYRVEAQFLAEERPDTLNLLTTTGENRMMVRAGKLQFQLQNQTHQLIAYRYLDPSQADFFIPFKDLTSGVATYGGGRYLDIDSSNPIVLDFNLAYNPYCVYNATFSCPIPPRENFLPLEIRVGELDYKTPS